MNCALCGGARGMADVYCVNCGEYFKKETNLVDERMRPLSTKEYVVMMLLACIPIVNIIVLIMDGMNDKQNLNRRNYAKASLIVIGASLAITVLIMVSFVGIIFSMYS